jgi:hypothetical protein
MQTATRTAIELHAAAIQLWCITDVDAPAETQAARVTTARLMSQHAIEANGNVALTPKHSDSEITQQEAQIDAACTDAETEAAIQAHASMIVALVMGE